MNNSTSRRSFLQNVGLGSLSAVAAGVKTSEHSKEVWK